jgi:lauroyl/myristoyl acyltransferase
MIDWILYKIGKFLALCLPLKISYFIACLIGKAKFYLSPKDRIAVISNIRTIVPEACRKVQLRLAREVFENFSKSIVDFFRFSKVDSDFIRDKVEINNTQYVESLLKEYPGIVIVSAHLGNWELGGAVVSRLGYHFYGIALPHLHPRVNDFFNEQRRACGEHVIPVGAGLRKTFSLLRNKNLVAFVADRGFGKGGMVIDFFGKKSTVPVGAAKFSLKTKTPILPVFMVRKKDYSFVLTIEKPVYFLDEQGKIKTERAVINEYFEVIARYIRRYPNQWYMFKSFFKD